MVAAAQHVAPERKLTTIDRAFSLLGGAKILHREVHTTLDAHDMVMRGLPSETLFVLIHKVPVLAQGDALERAIGMSVRTVQRRRKEPAPLSAEQGSRTWSFARIFAHAVEVLGSDKDAQEWMQRPALGLDNRPPIDLLGSAVGAEAVDHYLTRMEYGVYT